MAMEVGARWYVEVDDAEDYKRFQRGVGADLARRPDVMQAWHFTDSVVFHPHDRYKGVFR